MQVAERFVPDAPRLARRSSRPPAVDRRSVLIVADQGVVSDEMRRILESGGYRVVGIVRNREEFVDRVRLVTPDLVLIDVQLRGEAGDLGLASSVGALCDAPVVIVSAHFDSYTVDAIVEALRPAAFVAMPFSAAQLLVSVRLALASGRSSGRRIASGLVAVGVDDAAVEGALRKIASALSSLGVQFDERREPPRLPTSVSELPVLSALSVREREVAEQMAIHRRVGWVARALNISEYTVRNHLKSIYRKLEVHSQDELLALVLSGHQTKKPQL